MSKTVLTNGKKSLNGMKRILLLVGLALTAMSQAAAQTDYVFTYNYNGTYYIFGQTTSVSTDFIPNNCVYTGTSGGTFQNGNGYYIGYANQSVNFSTSSGSNLTISNNHLYYNNTYYLRYSNSNARWQFRDNYNAQATAYTVTKSSHIGSFSVSGDATIATTGTNSSYTHTNANYYDILSFDSRTYYSTNPSAAASTTAPTSGLPTLTTGYTWSLSANSYATVNATTGVVTVNSLPPTDQNVTLTCSVTRNGVTQTATKTITIEGPKVDPTGISITSGNSMSINVGNSGNITYSLTPSPCYNNVEFVSSNTGIATVSSSGVVTGVAAGSATITVTAKKIDGTTEAALTATVTVTVKDKVVAPVITYDPTPGDDGATATATITCSTPGVTIYYTTDGSTPTASSTEYTAPFTVNDGDEVRAIAIKTPANANWDNSDVNAQTYVSCSTVNPTITYTQSGSSATVTIKAETGATIYYTTDGSDPTTSTITSGTGSVTVNGVAGGATVKAIAKNGSCQTSSIVSEEIIVTGVSGGIVTINDLEDHRWSYYQSSGNLPTGYPTTYLSSPDPRNVKLTYMRGSVAGASEVAISAIEGDTMMVYYMTREKSVPGMTGDYPYTVISNPYSKRPRTTGSTGTDGFYGFAGWKVISGGKYIAEYGDGQTLPLDATIHFTNFDTYDTNAISADIVLQATWTPATVKTGNSAQSFTDGTYETNFWVLTGNPGAAVTVPANSTMTARYPDGTVSWDGNFTRAITAGGNNAKVEWVNMNSTRAVTAANYTFTMGRGIVNSGNGGELNLTTRDANSVNTVKIESGKYSQLRNFTVGLNAARTCDQLMILGCDYDRAKNDNTKLTIRGSMYVAGTSLNLNRASNSLYVRGIIKSGDFLSDVAIDDSYTGAGGTQTYYFSVGNSNIQNAGRRYLVVEGGILKGIAGGMDESDNQSTTDRAFDLRVRGTAQIEGVVYGAAEYANGKGIRTMVFTGGTVKGWIAGGANGTQTTNGALTGATYLYVGGNTRADSENSNRVLNRAVGGNVFGAGCGYSNSSSSGQILTYNTNVVLADDAYVERGIYGGGSYGYTTATANLYILGGTIDGQPGGVNETSYLAAVDGGVYGGACQNKGGNVNINMVGGTVNGSVYGGSNYTGTLSGTSTVTLNGGTVNGSLYGGGNGKGSATNVDRAVQVTVNGGTVTGAVYGCGNVSGAPQSTVNVDIYGTDPAPSANSYAIHQVFGGGNQANYSGTPQVTVHCGTDATTPISIGEVYGGGNQATVTGTNVTIGAGNKIGDVYGGGRQANVGTGGTSVTVNGGTIGRVFGGNNLSGTIASGTAGKIAVNVNKTSSCPMKIGQVFGGGNQAASQVGSITIGCTGTLVTPLATGQRYGYDQEGIGAVYGGANNAGITGDITLNIVSGIVDSVFGGNNAGGAINGDITVNVNKNGSAACASDWYVGYVFGGGNMATYSEKTSGHPAVNVKAGKVTHHVFGGGNGSGAAVTGNPTVTLSGTAEVGGNVFGGGNAAAVTGNTKVLIKD